MKQIGFRLNHICAASFGLRTRAGTIIQTITPIKKTRAQIQMEIDDPNQAERLKQLQQTKDSEQFQQYIYNLKYNDRNPQNFIKVKVNNSVAKVETPIQEAVPFIVKKAPKEEKVLISGIRRKVPASLKRLIPICRPLINLHIYQAQEALAESGRKASRFLEKTLTMVRSHATQRGYDPERLYVHSIQVGRFKKFRKARFHAKAKICPAERVTSQIKIVLEERPTKEMFKEFLVGKTPSVVSYLMKDQLVRERADYQKIRKWQMFLTAKGRQQQRLMLKRKAQMERREKGLSFKYVHSQLLEEQAKQLADNYDLGKIGLSRVNLESRQTLFKRNEENSS